MVGIAATNASRLPAEEMPFRIGAIPFDAIKIHAPSRTLFHRFCADRLQRYFRRRVPDLRGHIDLRRRPPTRSPALVVTVAIQINRKVDPVTGWCNFEF